MTKDTPSLEVLNLAVSRCKGLLENFKYNKRKKEKKGVKTSCLSFSGAVIWDPEAGAWGGKWLLRSPGPKPYGALHSHSNSLSYPWKWTGSPVRLVNPPPSLCSQRSPKRRQDLHVWQPTLLGGFKREVWCWNLIRTCEKINVSHWASISLLKQN